jgi:hypothetical protein
MRSPFHSSFDIFDVITIFHIIAVFHIIAIFHIITIVGVFGAAKSLATRLQ